MADRKITELSEAASIASGDVIVVVTGVGVGGATLTTNKVPLSGLTNHIVNIEELITSHTGIHLVSTKSSTAKNTLEINVSGYAYTDHTHVAANVTDFSSAVSGEVQQLIKFQTSDLANTGMLLSDGSGDLSIELAPNSKYVCQLGTRLMCNEDTDVSGIISVTGEMSVNYPTNLYGEWKDLEIDAAGHAVVHHESTSVSGYGKLIDSVGTNGLGATYTLVNEFTVETTNNEADTISFAFITNSADQATSGVLKKGSWLKAEKII
tara:strand:+ start:531 stop:1325 length:795 start_codon:yes stop_codon:yes gene_type:complete